MLLLLLLLILKKRRQAFGSVTSPLLQLEPELL